MPSFLPNPLAHADYSSSSATNLLLHNAAAATLGSRLSSASTTTCGFATSAGIRVLVAGGLGAGSEGVDSCWSTGLGLEIVSYVCRYGKIRGGGWLGERRE
jgi:hypothetical protein